MKRPDVHMAGVVTEALAQTGVTDILRASGSTMSPNQDWIVNPVSDSQFLFGCHGWISSTLDRDKVSVD
jgi:hypothetical protein